MYKLIFHQFSPDLDMTIQDIFERQRNNSCYILEVIKLKINYTKSVKKTGSKQLTCQHDFSGLTNKIEDLFA